MKPIKSLLFLAVAFWAGICQAQPPVKFSNEPRTNTINQTDLLLLDSDVGGGNFSTRTIVYSNVFANILGAVPPAHNAINNSNGIGTNTILYRNTNIALNVGASILSDSFGVSSIDFDGRQMADSQARLSVDFNGRQFWKNASTLTLDYGNSVLQGNWSVGGGLLTADGSAFFNIKGSAVNMVGGTNITITYDSSGKAAINVANNGLLGGQIPGETNYLDSANRIVFSNTVVAPPEYAWFDTNMNGFTTGSNTMQTVLGTNGTTRGAFDNDSFLTARMGLESGNIYSNYNRYMWTNWQAKVRDNKQKVLMLNQDGLSTTGLQSNFWHGTFTNIYPVAGLVLGQDFPTWYGNVNVANGGLATPLQDPLWVQGWFLLGNQNSNVVFQGGSVNPVADFGVVYWVEESTAGHFKVETNLAGGAYATVLGLDNVDASGGFYSLGAGTMRAQWATFTNPNPAALTIRVTELDSGKAVKILGAGFVNRTITNGVIEANWAGLLGTCGWSNSLTTNSQVFAQYLKFVNPTLMLSERVSWDLNADPGGSETYFQQYLAMVRTNTPFCDHVMTGVYPDDVATTQSTNEYRQLTNAIYRGLGYFDGVNPFVNVNNMTNRGYTTAADIVHATSLGAGAYDTVLTYWLDLTSAPRPAVYPFWLSAQQPEFLYQIDYSPGPANQADTLGYFLDLSGKGRDVYVFNGSTHNPIWTNNTSVINGRNWAWFPTGKFLIRKLPTPIAQPFSTWAVVKADTVGGNVWLSATNTGNATGMNLADNFMGADGTIISYALNPGQWYIIENVWNGANSYFQTNGAFGASGNAGAITMGTLTVGSGIDFGGQINGGIAFLGAYAGLPTTNFEAQMFSTLNNYYNVYTPGQTNVAKGIIASGTTVLSAGKVTVTPSPVWAASITNAIVASILGTNINNTVNISNVIDVTSFQIIASDPGATNRVYWMIAKP